jgi:peptide/nickel transport system substrate-binding protein
MLNNLKWITIGIFIGIILLVISSTFHQEIDQLRNTIASPIATNDKVITVGRHFTGVGLDPAVVIDQESVRISVNIYENLVAYNNDIIVPALAKSWTVSEDGLTWTFTLRDNIEFHDGTTFDAEAVAFNFNRWMDVQSPYHSGDFQYWNMVFGDDPGIVSSVQALSTNVLEIELNKPYAPFLSTLTMPAFGIASPTAVMKYNEDFRKKPVGTGPYALKSWHENGEIILEQNIHYWGQVPKVSTLVFTVLPDKADRVELLLRGKVQFLENLTPTEIERLQASEKVDLIKRPLTNIGYMAMNTENMFLKDREVRQAIGSAVKKEMANTGYFDSLNRWTDTFVPPGIWGNNNSIRFQYLSKKETQAVFDQHDASIKRLRLLVMREGRPYFPQPLKAAVKIQQALAPYGVEVIIVIKPWEDFLASIQEGDYDMLMMGWIADVMDPDNFLYTFFSSENIEAGVLSNYAKYDNNIVDQLLTLARQTTDHTFRESLYRKVQEIISYDVPAVPIVNTVTTIAVDKSIKNYSPTISGIEPLNEVDYERIQVDGE